MCSFVGKKKNKQRVWPAGNAETGETAGCRIGGRGKAGAGSLRKSLPPVYRQCAVCYTDFRSAYEEIFPSERHLPVPKRSGKTSCIERSDNTMRQRISRSVRKTLSFSEKTGNHIGAIRSFIHYCNDSLRNPTDMLPLSV
ncbi:MAG: IS1 transposase [Desulfobacteraceae bacterium IS3]|nr:MAG: IS1 transposase [Desulfobacteraceae bacterium IS3]